jgi:hypothetical protein
MENRYNEKKYEVGKFKRQPMLRVDDVNLVVDLCWPRLSGEDRQGKRYRIDFIDIKWKTREMTACSVRLSENVFREARSRAPRVVLRGHRPADGVNTRRRCEIPNRSSVVVNGGALS